MSDTPVDWYDRRHELRSGDVFRDFLGCLVRLYESVPGDATKWFVEDWSNGSWGYWASTIEPSDLVEKVVDPQLAQSERL